MRLHTSTFRTLLALSSLTALLLGWIPAAHASAPRRTAALTIRNVQVTHDRYLAHSEPAIAENPRNPRNLIAGSKFFSDPANYRFKIGMAYSMDGGLTWHDTGLLPGFNDFHTTSDVSIAFTRTGVAYVAVLACDGIICPGNGNRSGVFVSRSSDGGKTWGNPVAVFLDTTGATFSDKPWIGIDESSGSTEGTIYVAWNLDPVGDLSSCADADSARSLLPRQDVPVGGIAVSRSTDGGKTFSALQIVAPFTDQDSYIGAIPAVGSHGKLFVVFAGIACNSGNTTAIDMVVSKDRGKTFGALQKIVGDVASLPGHLPNGTFRNTSMPAFAVSPRDGSLVVTWADMRNGDADVMASSSTDSGTTWSPAYRVNHDHLKNGKDQFQPALAVAPNGVFTCAWFDRRHDPNNRLIDEEIAQSSNDGHTFGHNLRVTARSWDPAIDAPQPEGHSTNTFIGDYQALAADNATVHPLWNDTQNGKTQEIRTAVMPIALFTRR